MQNVKVISENGDNNTLSLSSAAVSITEPLEKPEDEQTKKVSAASENVPTLPTIKRPYGSMPNLSASITNGGDTAAIEAPTAVAVQQVSAEPLEYCPGSIELANYAGPQNAVLHWFGERGSDGATSCRGRSPDPVAVRHIRSAGFCSRTKTRRGSGESDAAKVRGFAGRPPRLWCSMPNIAIHYTDKVFYKTSEIECIALVPVSSDSLTGSSTTAVTERAEITPVKIKRCSLWKRAKKFTRRVFCCGAT